MNCDALLTGDASHHAFLDAVELDIILAAAGHFETENPAMTTLKNKLENQFPDVEFVLLEQSSPVKFIG